MPFFKLNPRVESQTFDLRPEGFRIGDMVRLDIVGDFRPTSNRDAGNFRDTYQNTAFRLGGETVRANPDTLKAERTTLVAINRDRSPLDNADPDSDYGVVAKLVPFTGGDDNFRFIGRVGIPDTFGSIYNARAGDDLVAMPNVPLLGFNHNRTFRAGSGDDTVRAGDLDLKLDLGTGVDTFELDDARVPWRIRENRDGDGTLVIKSRGGRDVVTGGEVIDHGTSDPLQKWFLDIARFQDGNCRISFFENGARVARVSGEYDEALPAATGLYAAEFARDGRLGAHLELIGAADPEVAVHGGGASEGGFAADDLLDTIMARVEAAYDLAGKALPWSGNAFRPLVPFSVSVRGAVEQPTLQFRNIATDDRVDREIDARFRLAHDGNERGLDDTSVQVFFTTRGTARFGRDWEFAAPIRRANGDNDFFGGVLRHGRDADGDRVYSVMIESGARGVDVPIRILDDRGGEGAERLILDIVEVDLWRDGARGPVLYELSGGPRIDRESDFDGPSGAEALLVRDHTLVVTIADDLVA